MKKELKSIPGDPGYYINSDRRVWSAKSGKWLKVHVDEAGYEVVSLQRKGQSRVVRIHGLLLETFVGPRPPGMQCRHLDGDRSNNNLDNLCWGTRRENANDRIKHGKNVYSSGPRKLSNELVVEIRASNDPVSVLASRFHVCQQTVYDIISRKHYPIV